MTMATMRMATTTTGDHEDNDDTTTMMTTIVEGDVHDHDDGGIDR